MYNTYLSSQQLNHLAHSHTRRESMRIHDRIYHQCQLLPSNYNIQHTRRDPLVVKWHVFLIHDQPTNTLLPMPRTKLVPQLWPPRLPYQYFDQRLVVLRVRQHDLVHVSCYRRLVDKGRVLVRYGGGRPGK